MMMEDHAAEVARGDRFEFGANWALFLSHLDERRITVAKQSLVKMLGMTNLHGKCFLDVGCGSGLFSLAARRLGATVHSIDFDPESVSCANELRRRYYSEDPAWTIEQASVLDEGYLQNLGKWDIVYSWGVLHHTGAMWTALKNVSQLVARGGSLFISIYNDQGIASKLWMTVKHVYNRVPRQLRWLILLPSLIWLWAPRTIFDFGRCKPFYIWRHYSEGSLRGMSPWRDVVDWVGGYPFEVAKPEEIFIFYRNRGFSLKNMVTCGGKLGCNEFVFTLIRAHAIYED